MGNRSLYLKYTYLRLDQKEGKIGVTDLVVDYMLS